MKNSFDVIVVGAGHAGLEAAFSNANLGLSVAIITFDKKTIAETPCNPSIGGPAKGIVTREIDALGGMQGRAADFAQLQIKLLNTSKGAGVWALRSQIDKVQFHKFFLKEILKNKKITLIEAEVTDLIIKDMTCLGVEIDSSKRITAKATIITTGTYLKSTVHVGNKVKNTGPNNAKRSELLSNKLKKLGFQIIRLKTGTPPRILKSSIDFSKTKPELGTDLKLCFSHFNQIFLDIKKQEPCYLTHTNQNTHNIILKNLKQSAMYSGKISGVGPRYCPSIEDKIVRFHDKSRHQIFIEPESKQLDTMYLQGLSTSLPHSVQEKFVHTIKGLEKAIFVKHAYAIEYDSINPIQLWPTLETKIIKSLYTAGQINGTSGYEEAACQGLVAGINAYLKIKLKKAFILKRSEAYIGVLIDDLVTKGISDPYRLLTSRAEHRLFLRNDNADDRLLSYGKKFGLISSENYKKYDLTKKQIKSTILFLKNSRLNTNKPLLKKYGSSNHNLFSLLKRPEVKLQEILPIEKIKKLSPQTIQKIEILTKFEGYIKNQLKAITNLEKHEKFSLEKIKTYSNIKNLSLEARDKLNKVMPLTLGQAQRISGINIADLVIIKYYIEHGLK